MMPLRVALTIDVEPDCPPFLWGFRGIEQGMPTFLDLLDNERIPATCFTTGDVARQYPAVVERIVADGHELACHGMSHRAFTSLDVNEAEREIEESAAILRRFAKVGSFRAPYLQFPSSYLPILERSDFVLDSSQAKYKLQYYRECPATRLIRIPASVTSSVLRLPRPIRNAWMGMLADPIVLFVHPWEFVDLRHERLRVDCRFNTGSYALECLHDIIHFFRHRSAMFVRMQELIEKGDTDISYRL